MGEGTLSLFPSLAVMSFDTPLSLLIKSSTNSSGFSLTRMSAVGGVDTHHLCFGSVDTKPNLSGKLFSLSVLACMLCWLVDRRARSSAKSRSGDQSPLDANGSVGCGVGCDSVYGDQKEDRGDDAPLSHSGLHGKTLREVISHDDTTLKMFIECFHD